MFAINPPKAVDRCRDRHGVSGANPDPSDALVLAHLLRTDRDQHLALAGDSELGQAVACSPAPTRDLV